MFVYSLRTGSILDKATNEKQPYVYVHVYVYGCRWYVAGPRLSQAAPSKLVLPVRSRKSRIRAKRAMVVQRKRPYKYTHLNAHIHADVYVSAYMYAYISYIRGSMAGVL